MTRIGRVSWPNWAKGASKRPACACRTQTGLAGACVFSDAQSVSSGGGDAGSQSRGGHEMVFGRLYVWFQPAAQALRTFVQRSYKRLIVDGSGDGYLKRVCDYVHLNPVRASLIAEDQRLETYRWSSYPRYLQAPSRRLPWLRTERLLGEWSVPADRTSGRRMFAAQMEARRAGEGDQDYKPLRRGWFLGGKQ